MSSTGQDNCRSPINISKAIIHAENELLEDNQPASEKKVDDDWLYSWRDYAGRISSEDLQQLWGKILAGEVKSPGKYSLRTLEFLKGLSKSEAEQISRLAQFVIHGMIARDVLEPLEKAGLSFAVLLQMQDLGVLSGVESIGLKRTFTSVVTDKFIAPIIAGNKALIIEHAAPAKRLELSVYVITTIGAQLLELGQFEPNLEYLRQLGKKIATQDFTVRLADWKPDNNGGGSYFNAVQITA